MRRTEMTKKTAANKGYAAAASAAATMMLCFVFSWWLLIIGAPVTAYLTYRWFQYRAEWGMRF